MDTTILDNLIRQFNTDNLVSLFRQKTRNFRLLNENWPQYDQELFTHCNLVGEFKTTTDDLEMLVFTARTNSDLSERSGKKSQYELGKKILKDQLRYAGGFFVFYDKNGNFRFSLIYDIPQADGSRQYSNFRRYTYFVSKEQTNKTFKQQISEADFSSLDKIIEAFSVDKVRKEFYTEIATWYFWAMDKIKFPDDYKYSDDPAKDAEIRNSTNLIRLITRIIFIWFLKEKNLVPNTLFDPEKLKNIVKDFYTSNQTANYYNAILQNLFFGTLNQQMNERKFAKDAGFNENRLEFGVKNLYRYTDKFTIPENEAIALFKDIPFLNGGLFDCLDKDSVYIDGFSRNPKKQAVVFDYLFFQGREEKVNLSQYDMGKDKRVRGLFEILKSYNFTIDESTPIDQEVALDPELLGKVFEELLASYNPETASTARKATGSYYTPREIVDYMVQQSLKQYFTTHTQLSEETIDQLLSYSDSLPELTDDQRKQIIALIDNIKILDPACGSGAFPMGILHQLVFLLQKLDPDNKLWHELQYQKALQATQEAFKHTDKQEREELLKEISESFDESINHPDYARKLYLIENCIYGVDIQPIAIQISKLRFFISLVLDQKIDARKENYGIRPLPNLETKFVAANTLIGLELLTTDLFSENNPIKLLQEQLKATRHAYFNAKMRKEKLKLIQQEKELRKKIAEHVGDTLIHKNEEEIKNLEKCLAEARKKLVQIEKVPEQKETIKTVNIFGDIETIFIDKKKKKIKAQKSQISFIAKQINTLKAANTKDAIQKVAQQISTFDQYDQNASTDWFDPEWMFGVTEGFDIVIGNPPYIQLQKDGGRLAKLYEKQNYQTFARTGDIYCLFYEKGLQLLQAAGILCYITSNKWMRAGYGEKLRSFFTQYNPMILIDLGPGVFENATVDTNILLIQKKQNTAKQLKAVTLQKQNDTVNINHQIQERAVILDKLTSDAWFIGSSAEQQLKEKIERLGKPLKDWDVNIYRGVLTGLNEAFIITTEKRNEILANCKDEAERRRTEAIIKPILRGKDIRRYYYEWAGLWVIVIPAGWTNQNKKNKNAEQFIENSFPSLMRHLKQYEAKAKKRDDQGDYWWELRHCAYYPEFEKEKIIYIEIMTDNWEEGYEFPCYAYRNDTCFVLNTAYIMTGKNLKYILGLLNSKFGSYLVKQHVTQLQKRQFRMLAQYVNDFEIPPVTSANQPIVKQIENLVDKILAAKKSNPQADTKNFEDEIDKLVYKLYNLTPEEIKIVEGGK